MGSRQTKHAETFVIEPRSRQSLPDLLRSWREADASEQRETLEYLKQALDRDRLSGRKLFE